MRIISIIFLWPFALLFWLVSTLRNIFYNKGWLASSSFKTAVICVGNLNTGGTGKSPMVEFLIRLLVKNNIVVGTLSRGYGRKTRGFAIATPDSRALTLGDEPMQFYRKFPDVPVCVCEDRMYGANQLIQHCPQINTIVLDDAFQHRAIRPGFSLLLTEYNRPYFNDIILPIGRLRECRLEAKRADLIIVTKTPENASKNELANWQKKIKLKSHQELFFAYIKYLSLVPFFQENQDQTNISADTSIVLFTGIARPEPLLRHLQQIYRQVTPIRFSDHHVFTKRDIQEVLKTFCNIASPNKIILSTEKDFVRLINTSEINLFRNVPVYYQAVEMCFSELDNQRIEKIILNYVRKN